MYIPSGAVDSEDANNRILPGEWRQVMHEATNLPPTQNRNSAACAKVARLYMAGFFMTAVQSVPWQNKAVDCNFVDPHPLTVVLFTLYADTGVGRKNQYFARRSLLTCAGNPTLPGKTVGQSVHRFELYLGNLKSRSV